MRIGYARVTTSGEVSGVVAYTRTDVDASRVQYQNAAPFSLFLQDFTIAVKFVPGVGDMAFAIVNPPSEAVNPAEEETARIVFRLYDEAPSTRAGRTWRAPPSPDVGGRS